LHLLLHFFSFTPHAGARPRALQPRHPVPGGCRILTAVHGSIGPFPSLCFLRSSWLFLFVLPRIFAQNSQKTTPKYGIQSNNCGGMGSTSPIFGGPQFAEKSTVFAEFWERPFSQPRNTHAALFFLTGFA